MRGGHSYGTVLFGVCLCVSPFYSHLILFYRFPCFPGLDGGLAAHPLATS